MESIWDQILLEERKAKAKALGVRICDIEEEEILVDSLKQSLCLDASTSKGAAISVDIENAKPETESKHGIDHLSFTVPPKTDEISHHKKIVNVIDPTISSDPIVYNKHTNSLDNDSGPWHQLVPELVDRILIYMGDVDMCGYLRMTSKTVFQPNETVYRTFCETIYLKQTAKKQLLLSNWVTFGNMIINRPRLRLNGFYTLKTLYSRAPSNDNFWEPKQYASVETVYYRHLRFYNDGRVLYSIDLLEPSAAEKNMLAGVTIPKKVFEGTYTLTGRHLTVEIPLHYCTVSFDMRLLNGDDGYRGHHNMLRLLSHCSRPVSVGPSGTIQPQQHQHEKVEYSLPRRTDFRFHRFYNSVNLSSF